MDRLETIKNQNLIYLNYKKNNYALVNNILRKILEQKNLEEN